MTSGIVINPRRVVLSTQYVLMVQPTGRRSVRHKATATPTEPILWRGQLWRASVRLNQSLQEAKTAIQPSPELAFRWGDRF